jgi:hypothetical protein
MPGAQIQDKERASQGIAPTLAHAPSLGSILTFDRATDATITWKQ